MTEKGVGFESVQYLDERLSADELKTLLHRAGLKPRDVVRKNEPAYRELVSDRDLSDAELIALLAKRPELIQRPIVVRGNKAVLARPIARLRDLGIDL